MRRISRERAAKLASIRHERAVLISIAQVLFLAGITVAIILGSLDYLGVEYGTGTKLLYGVLSISLILAAYFFFAQVDEIDFFDFVSAMIFTSELRRHARGRVIDSSATQLFLGVVLAAIAPIMYTKTGDVSYTAAALFMSGLLIATSIVGYITAAHAND